LFFKGATALNRALLYIATAVVVGLTLVLAPATIFANKNAGKDYAVLEQVPIQIISPNQTGQPGGFFDLAQSSYPSADFTVLAVCFAVALAAYLLLKRRAPRSTIRWMSPY
jgi:hypothetical protein